MLHDRITTHVGVKCRMLGTLGSPLTTLLRAQHPTLGTPDEWHAGTNEMSSCFLIGHHQVPKPLNVLQIQLFNSNEGIFLNK